MATPQLPSNCRLHGKNIFLSASIPTIERGKEFHRIPEAPLRIEEAVICVARAIFMEGGTLTFGAHPSISPLIARVIDHYYLPAPAEEVNTGIDREHHDLRWRNPSLTIYQSRVWQEHWVEATKRLTRHPLVKVVWTEKEGGEFINMEILDQPQAPKSINIMRKAMIKQSAPVAMVAIGGMDGVLDEAQLFAELRPGKPIFTLGTTGGAAALLSNESSLNDCLRIVDTEAEGLVRKFWKQQDTRKGFQRFGDEENQNLYVPYALVAQQIVAAVLGNSGSSSQKSKE